MPLEGDPVFVGKEPYPPEKKFPLDTVFAAVPVGEGYGWMMPEEVAALLETLLLLSKNGKRPRSGTRPH